MRFEMLKDKSSIIKVIGVGGGGGNAVNHMYKQGIVGVDFIICNTDAQALELSPIPNKIQLGASLTEGRGAGSMPEVGMNSAIESIDDVKELLGANTKMIFITAGMGGGTGTGASPIIAQAAKEMGILTVGIVTTPFTFEGKRRKMQADDGLEQLKQHVDSLLVISNDKLREMFGNLTLSNAFAQADNILTTAAKGIAEIITVPGYINVDFEDVQTVMCNSGVAIMGSATAEGEGRAYKAVQAALASPLLNDNEIEGARYILLNITSGMNEVLMDEVGEITDYIQNEAGLTADIIWGNCYDETLGESISVTLIATGFQPKDEKYAKIHAAEKKVTVLTTEEKIEERKPEIAESKIGLKEPALVITNIKKEMEPVLKNVPKTTVTIVTPTPSKQVNLFDFIPKEEKTEEKKEEIAFTAEVQETEFKIITKTSPEPENNEETEQMDEQWRRNKERIARLKELSMKLRTPNGLSDLENEPAYKRKNQILENIPHSSEPSQLSRYTLTDDNGETEIRPNNPFLHDNVD
jgi:cell division protein FtsZ